MLSRYEVTLERSLYKALHELQRLEAAQAAPLAEAVEWRSPSSVRTNRAL